MVNNYLKNVLVMLLRLLSSQLPALPGREVLFLSPFLSFLCLVKHCMLFIALWFSTIKMQISSMKSHCCWELPCLVSEATIPPWLRLSKRPWDHKPLWSQSLSSQQGCRLCPLYFTLLGPGQMTS